MTVRTRGVVDAYHGIAIAPRSTSAGVGERLLQQIISTIGSSLDLEEVLDGIVSLLSDASAVNGCFVYLLDRDRKRLILRAASAPYAPPMLAR